jgi:hypothetical protein
MHRMGFGHGPTTYVVSKSYLKQNDYILVQVIEGQTDTGPAVDCIFPYHQFQYVTADYEQT